MLTTTLLWVAIIVTLLAFIGRHLNIHPFFMRVIMLAGLGTAIGCLIIIGGWAWLGVLVAALLCCAIIWASEDDTAKPTSDVANQHTVRSLRPLPRHATIKGTTLSAKHSTPAPRTKREQCSKGK